MGNIRFEALDFRGCPLDVFGYEAMTAHPSIHHITIGAYPNNPHFFAAAGEPGLFLQDQRLE